MSNAEPKFDYRLALADELKSRHARNPKYSLRSFARDLGVSPTALCDVLAAKRDFSKKNALRVIDRLGWSPLQSQAFLQKIELGTELSPQTQADLLLHDDRFRFISDWYYMVILNLAKLPEAKSSPRWLSRRLGIGVIEAKEAVQRLKRMGYVDTTAGRLKRLVPTVQTGNDVPSAAIRKYHRQNFQVAASAQENVPFALRQITSFTIATDAARVQKGKILLAEFLEKLEDILESPHPTEVYTVSAQLFPAYLFSEDIS